MKIQFALITALSIFGTPLLSGIGDAAIAAPLQLAQSTQPARTVMSVLNENEIAIQITDGDFFFAGDMQRHYGGLYAASNRDVRVSYNSETDEVLVVDNGTNDELYRYSYSLDEVTGSGDAPLTRNPGPRPVTYTTVIDDDHIRIQISEGDFFFSGLLERVNNETFMGQEGKIRVVYDRDRDLIYVVDVLSRSELYSYAYSEVDESSR